MCTKLSVAAMRFRDCASSLSVLFSGLSGALHQVRRSDPRWHDAAKGDRIAPPPAMLQVRRLRGGDRRKVLQHWRKGRLHRRLRCKFFSPDNILYFLGVSNYLRGNSSHSFWHRCCCWALAIWRRLSNCIRQKQNKNGEVRAEQQEMQRLFITPRYSQTTDNLAG